MAGAKQEETNMVELIIALALLFGTAQPTTSTTSTQPIVQQDTDLGG